MVMAHGGAQTMSERLTEHNIGMDSWAHRWRGLIEILVARIQRRSFGSWTLIVYISWQQPSTLSSLPIWRLTMVSLQHLHIVPRDPRYRRFLSRRRNQWASFKADKQALCARTSDDHRITIVTFTSVNGPPWQCFHSHRRQQRFERVLCQSSTRPNLNFRLHWPSSDPGQSNGCS